MILPAILLLTWLTISLHVFTNSMLISNPHTTHSSPLSPLGGTSRHTGEGAHDTQGRGHTTRRGLRTPRARGRRRARPRCIQGNISSRFHGAQATWGDMGLRRHEATWGSVRGPLTKPHQNPIHVTNRGVFGSRRRVGVYNSVF